MPRPSAFIASAVICSCCCVLAAACRSGGAKRETEVVAPAPEIVLRGIADRKNVRILLETDRGAIHCTIDAARTPMTAALFVGLATGRAAHRDPRTGATLRSAFYDHRRFFRRIPDVYVQTGCPLDTGMGQPGYRIPPETRPDDARRLAEPGVLFMATYTAPPNRVDPSPPPPGHTVGSQFVIAVGNMSHLAGTTTVLGHCDDASVVRAISQEMGAPPELVRVTVDGVAQSGQ